MCHICQNSNIFTVNAKQDAMILHVQRYLEHAVNRMNVRFNKFARIRRKKAETFRKDICTKGQHQTGSQLMKLR